MELLILSQMVFGNISDFSLVILVGISEYWDALVSFNSLISISISFRRTSLKLKAPFLLHLVVITRMLGCFSYLRIASKVGSLTFFTVEEFCQHRKKKKSARDCWRIVPVTVDQSYQWLLNNRASDCWRIIPVTVKESCQWLLNNCASNCWKIMPVTVEESCQPLLINCASDCWTIVQVTVEESCQPLLNNPASDCWRIVPVTLEQSCQWLLINRYQWLLNNCTSDCWRIVPVTEKSCQRLWKNHASHC